MKALYLLAIIAGSMSVALAQVSPEEHAAHHPEKAATPAEPPGKAVMADSSMQARMKTMQELMNKIGQTKDPAERARLLDQHREAMHEQLASMKRIDCMMGGEHEPSGPEAHAGNGASGKQTGGMMSSGMMKCHEMMQARMDMMVGMMDQMMRHEDAQDSPR